MIKVIFDEKNKRSVAYDDNLIIGECDYTENEKVFNIYHTKVSKDYQKMGIAKKLVDTVISNAEKLNKDITATCSYAKKVIKNKK